MKRLLIANRGEISVRIARAARELSIETVAVYNDSDESSSHRWQADYAVRLAGEELATTYLDSQLLVRVALACQCDAVHPGYGFLSESVIFAEAVRAAGIIFVGPANETIRLLGNKLNAKRLLAEQGIPVVAGALQAVTTIDEINPRRYPILLKAAHGGGGRGIRIVNQADDLNEALVACQREAENYFANGELLWEELIIKPRHIEVQIIGDQHGNIAHLYERDCSLQRRYQKIIEEAPSCYLNDDQRQHIGQLAVKIAKTVGYHNAGTVEFICASPDECYFMEVNTRIQVEHPVTEMITGIDLIKEQLQIARGEPLSFSQQEITVHGHAIEARINCEDPQANFTPCPAEIGEIHFPDGAFTRIDSHIYRGYCVPRTFDSLLAKLCCWGRDRKEAIARINRALSELYLEGIRTTTPFHQRLLAHKDFIAGNFSTDFVGQLSWESASLATDSAKLATMIANVR